MSNQEKFLKDLNSEIDKLVKNPTMFNYNELVDKIRKFSIITFLEMRKSSEIEELYKLIYKIIKLEYIVYGRSRVENTLESNNIDPLKLIDYVVKNGNDAFDEFDTDFAIFSEYLTDLKNEMFNGNIKELPDNIKASNKKLKYDNKEAQELLSEIRRDKSTINKRRIRLIIKSLSLVALTLVTNRALRLGLSEDIYIRTDETYSTITDDIIITKEKETRSSNDKKDEHPEIIIRRYEPYDGGDKRKYLEIRDVTDTGSTLPLHASKDIAYEKNSKEEKTLSIKDGDKINTYEKAYNEIIRQTYEYVDTDDYIAVRLLILFALYVLLFLLGRFIDIGLVDNGWDNNWRSEYKKSYLGIKRKLKFNKEDLDSVLDDLEKVLEDLYNQINDFERIQPLIKDVVKENSYLLDDPELLEYKLRDLIDNKEIEKGKSYIKKYGKKRHN